MPGAVKVLLRVLVALLVLAAAGTLLWSVTDRDAATSPPPAPSPSPRAPQTGASAAEPVVPTPKDQDAGQGAGQGAPQGGSRPLRSITIALDPGHQLGNAAHPAQTNALVPAGGFQKPCNTTGTATQGGVAESTVNLQLADAVARRLRGLGAVVKMTRTVDSPHLWGPCVDERGRFGQRVGAQLMVSLHADGAGAAERGFHVIAPLSRRPWTDDIAVPSRRLATALRDALTASGVPRSNYVAAGTGLNLRDDLGTLNASDVPVAMIEIGNMRNSGDAQRMTSSTGQAADSAAIVRGIRAYLGK